VLVYITTKITLSSIDSSISRTVRKDNTIIYLSNRYSVPLGTYQKGKKVSIEVTDENYLIIREEKNGKEMADHKISHEKGKLIQSTQHKRDRTKGIPAFMDSVSKHFDEVELAYEYLEEVHRRYPRYIRDQLQLILKTIKADLPFINEALQECVQRGIYSAPEFSDVVQYIKRQRQMDNKPLEQMREDIKPSHDFDRSVMNTKPTTREVNDYLELLKGASV